MEPRELVLLRHAKSAWDTDAPTDFDRPLSPRGRRDAPRMGDWMRTRDLLPDLVVSSPARRARQTARRVLEAFDDPALEVRWEPRLYEADVETLLDVLAEVPPEVRRVLLVGHNPSLEALVLHLAGGAGPLRAETKVLPTAALVRLRMPEDWASLPEGSGEIVEHMRPKRVPD